ncbi:PadR family transcriptional regulator [bacterium]|nr:MAG: PadR family transcriptional regulator [bacterium]
MYSRVILFFGEDMAMKDDITKGHTQTMILAVLDREPLHGYAIAREIERKSDGLLTCQEGVLYPALRAMEREGLVSSQWENQTNGPARKIYTITESGQNMLTKRTQAWQQLQVAMGSILRGKPNEQTS